MRSRLPGTDSHREATLELRGVTALCRVVEITQNQRLRTASADPPNTLAPLCCATHSRNWFQRGRIFRVDSGSRPAVRALAVVAVPPPHRPE
jgi:hypothetical protein